MSWMQSKKGKYTFVPKNKEKCVNKKYPQARSSWENDFMTFLDENSNVLKWASEPFFIPYFDPVKNKQRRYYPDFLIKMKTNNGIKIFLVEVKPNVQTKKPKRGNKKTKTYLRESVTYKTNIGKWKAAKIYAEKRGWEFLCLTEKEIYGKL